MARRRAYRRARPLITAYQPNRERLMTQNTSNAVMATRIEPRDSLDDFPTPPWATRALCRELSGMGFQLAAQTCREPTANRGHMAFTLEEYFGAVHASDVFDYGEGFPVSDFLTAPPLITAWAIFNPPFRLAEEFINKAMDETTMGVCVITRSVFLESVGRYQRLFRDRPPAYVYQFSERVVMHKGKLSAKGSTATAYSWLIWRHAKQPRPPEMRWIAPCRAMLEKPEDYL